MFVALMALSFAPLIGASEEAPPEEDPWTGKSRAEVIELLGDPKKIKKAGKAGETLIYRFRRVDPAQPPGPLATLIPVPGVGLVARIETAGSKTEAPMSMEPMAYDDRGRPRSGGVSSSQSASASYDPKTGKLERTPTGPEKPAGKGKVKLRFVLDANGRVEEWSASGKQES